MEPGHLHQPATKTHSATSYVPGFLFRAQVLSGQRGKCFQDVPYALLLRCHLCERIISNPFCVFWVIFLIWGNNSHYTLWSFLIKNDVPLSLKVEISSECMTHTLLGEL